MAWWEDLSDDELRVRLRAAGATSAPALNVLVEFRDDYHEQIGFLLGTTPD